MANTKNTKKKTNPTTKKSTSKVVDTKEKNTKSTKGTSKVVEHKAVKNAPKKIETTKKTKDTKVKDVVKENGTKKGKDSNEFKLTNKQKDIVLVLLAVVLLVVATILTKEPKLNIELPIALQGEAGYHEINLEEYNKKVEAKEPFVVVIVRDGCRYCEDYKPVVEKVSKDLNLPITYINLSHLSNEDAQKFIDSNKYFRKNQQWGTPTTLFMYGEDIVDSLGGYVDEKAFTSFAKENFKVN